ncbi:MAG: ThiF family adenylyltransferase [Huintestinicola sp.]
MLDQFSRTELMFGREAMNRLRSSRVAVFGVGGVGGYAVEALARSGIGTLDLIDNDKVCETNINRQIIALHSTVDMYKVDAAAERIHDICPDTRVNTYKCFFMPDTSADFDFTQYDYVIDAIDTVKGKIEIIRCAKAADVPVISCMGAGNKLDPTKFRVADISQTRVCPLARVMRYELKKLGITGVKTLYSEEQPAVQAEESEEKGSSPRRSIPASNAFVPSAAGLIIAGEVIKDIAGIKSC